MSQPLNKTIKLVISILNLIQLSLIRPDFSVKIVSLRTPSIQVQNSQSECVNPNVILVYFLSVSLDQAVDLSISVKEVSDFVLGESYFPLELFLF